MADVADYTQAVNVTGGSVSILGTATVSISGTPAVSISGIPAVTINSGSVTATISGTPSVNIASQTGNVNVAIQGTPTVIISGTPSVNIANTPSVVISSGVVNAQVAGSLLISGTTTVSIAGSSVGIVGAVSGSALGDVGAPVQDKDSATDTVSTAQTIGDSIAALASFKRAGAADPALVKSGPAIVGTTAAVNPAFGQAPGVGNLLVAWVTAVGGDPTTATAGWSQVVESSGSGQAGRVAIWIKPNSAGGDPAPAFTSTGTFPMHAQLAEFSGCLTAAPTDLTATVHPGLGTAAVIATMAAVDAVIGDLVVMVTQWGSGVTMTATSTEAYNNSATAIHAGDAGSGTQQQYSSHSFAVIPLTKISLPVGTRPWDADVTGTSASAAGAQASVVLAASPGKAYRLHSIEGGISQSAATAANQGLQVLDGAAIFWQVSIGVTAAIGASAAAGLSQLAHKGTVGNSMTAKMSGTTAGLFESVSIGCYLQ